MQIDANGQIFVKPDFNGEKPPYRIETQNDLRGTVNVTIQRLHAAILSFTNDILNVIYRITLLFHFVPSDRLNDNFN